MDTLFEHIALASIEEARRPLLPLHSGQATPPPPEPEPEVPLEPVPYADEGDADDGLVYFSSRLVRLPAGLPGCLSLTLSFSPVPQPQERRQHRRPAPGRHPAAVRAAGHLLQRRQHQQGPPAQAAA